MGILSRYILRQIWMPAFYASVVIIFLVIASSVQKQLGVLMQKLPIAQITLEDISWMSLLAAPTLIGYIIPITFLMGIMLTFGRLSQSHELTAMKAAGISVRRLVLPVIIAGAGLSVLCFAAQNLAKPWAWSRMMRMLSHDLPLRVTIDMLPTGTMHNYGDWRVYIGSRDENGVLHDIVILQPQEDGQATAFYADEAELFSGGDKGMMLTLRNGHFIMPDRNGMAPRSVFPEMKITVPSIEAFDPPNDFNGMTLPQLLGEEARLKGEVERTQAEPVVMALYGTRNELGQRFAFPLMCLTISLAAAPLAGRTRRGGRSFLFVGSLGLLALYFLLKSMVQPPGLMSLPTMALIAQTPNIVMCIMGLALLWKVNRI